MLWGSVGKLEVAKQAMITFESQEELEFWERVVIALSNHKQDGIPYHWADEMIEARRRRLKDEIVEAKQE
jgi:hypothetical protein